MVDNRRWSRHKGSHPRILLPVPQRVKTDSARSSGLMGGEIFPSLQVLGRSWRKDREKLTLLSQYSLIRVCTFGDQQTNNDALSKTCSSGHVGTIISVSG